MFVKQENGREIFPDENVQMVRKVYAEGKCAQSRIHRRVVHIALIFFFEISNVSIDNGNYFRLCLTTGEIFEKYQMEIKH